MATISINAPARIAAPRAAPLAAALFARVLGWFDRRAERSGTPDDDRAGDAARLRSFAQQVMAEDPRFAADLFAAADRHERG